MLKSIVISIDRRVKSIQWETDWKELSVFLLNDPRTIYTLIAMKNMSDIEDAWVNKSWL